MGSREGFVGPDSALSRQTRCRIFEGFLGWDFALSVGYALPIGSRRDLRRCNAPEPVTRWAIYRYVKAGVSCAVGF